MTILLMGLNYQIAPVELRERLYVMGDALHNMLTQLHGEKLAEVVIVSTCNRLEIYANVINVEAAVEIITAYLVDPSGLSTTHLQPYLQTLLDRHAVQHVLRVASGLESLVLGESEILGQVADALSQAQQAGTIGAVLSRLFQAALHTGKRARTESAIAQHTLSISHAAVLMAKRELPDFASKRILVVGAGRMAELAVRALMAQGASQIQVINRTFERAASLANRLGIATIDWQDLRAAVNNAQVVILTTSTPQPILSVGDFRATQPLIVLDIGVPRNVQADVRQLPQVQLYDIDELQAVVADHRSMRQAEVEQVENIVASELTGYVEWLNSRSAASTIGALRHKADTLAEAELARAFQRLPDLSEHEREVVAQMAYRIVNKLLHPPTAALRARAAQGDNHFAYLHAAQQLFDLEVEADRE